MTPTGLALFAAWNGLLTTMIVLAFVAFGRRLRGPAETPATSLNIAGYDPRGGGT
jgi:hypothetical protein